MYIGYYTHSINHLKSQKIVQKIPYFFPGSKKFFDQKLSTRMFASLRNECLAPIQISNCFCVNLSLVKITASERGKLLKELFSQHQPVLLPIVKFSFMFNPLQMHCSHDFSSIVKDPENNQSLLFPSAGKGKEPNSFNKSLDCRKWTSLITLRYIVADEKSKVFYPILNFGWPL